MNLQLSKKKIKMTKEEIETIMSVYVKLEEECKRIAKLYLDFKESRGYERPPNHTGTGAYPVREYYGHINSVHINTKDKTFTASYSPSTSGIGGNITLSLDFVYNDGKGIEEKVDEDYKKAIEERKERTCKTCGHMHTTIFSDGVAIDFPFNKFV